MKTERISDNLVHKISWFNLLTFQSKPYFVTFKQSEWIFKDLTKAFHIAKPNQTVGNRQQLQQTFKYFGFEYTQRVRAWFAACTPMAKQIVTDDISNILRIWMWNIRRREEGENCTATVREESRLPFITILTGTVTWKMDLIMNNQI